MDSLLSGIKTRHFQRIITVAIAFSLTIGLLLAFIHFTPEYSLYRPGNNIGKAADTKPKEKARTLSCKTSAGIWHDAQTKYAYLRDDKFTYVHKNHLRSWWRYPNFRKRNANPALI